MVVLTSLLLAYAASGSAAFRAMATGLHRSCRCCVCLSSLHGLLTEVPPCMRSSFSVR